MRALPLLKEVQTSCFGTSTVCRHRKKALYLNQEMGPQRTPNMPSHLSWASHTPQTMRNKCLLLMSHLAYGIRYINLNI
jgi:hypothetical protein